MSGSLYEPLLSVMPAVVLAQSFSNASLASLTSVRTVFSTSLAAVSNWVRIFFSSSSSMERFTSDFTSAT